jgi:hypothetical protein
MNLFLNKFAGHMPEGDPRTPLAAAGGCTWPTCPAFRYAILSDDATEELAFFNTTPVIIQFVGPWPSHNLAGWSLIIPHPDVVLALATKSFTQGESTYRWAFGIDVDEFPGHPLLFSTDRPLETCNRTIPLPNVEAFDPASGETGDTFRMEQVVWNEDLPPS